MHCARCWEEVRPEAKFCPACGAPTPTSTRATADTRDESLTEAVGSTSQVETATPAAEGVGSSSKRKTAVWFAVASICVLVLIGGVLAVTGLFGGSSATSSKAPASVGNWSAPYRNAFLASCLNNPDLATKVTPTQYDALCRCVADGLEAQYPNQADVPSNTSADPASQQVISMCIKKIVG
jgi:hypothetical protein